MSTEEKADYEVGWGKPPQHTRFAKGQSGNPKGREKGSKNFSTVLTNTLNETVVVNENGLRKNISKLEAMTKQLVNKAATGDPRATQTLLRVLQVMEGPAEPAAQEPVASESDREVMEGLVARMRRTGNGESNE
jgi:hypothetical protein